MPRKSVSDTFTAWLTYCQENGVALDSEDARTKLDEMSAGTSTLISDVERIQRGASGRPAWVSFRSFIGSTQDRAAAIEVRLHNEGERAALADALAEMAEAIRNKREEDYPVTRT